MIETLTRAGALLALLACMGCTVESSGKTDSAIAPVPVVDSLTGLAADVDQVPRAADAPMVRDVRAPSTAAQDTVVPVPMVTVPVVPVPEPLAVQTMPVTPPPGRRVSSDTSSITATPDELRTLRGALAIPVEGVRAGELRDTYTESRGGRLHEAIDIAAARGTPVLSVADGRVLKRYSSVPGGLMIYAADASDSFIFMYGHLERYADGVTEGMTVRRGQLLGYVGTSGNAPPNAPHLHFAIARGRPSAAWWRGVPVNPYPLLVP